MAAAKELAPKNIRVNSVAPGFIDTAMTRQLPPEKFSNAWQASAWAGSARRRKWRSDRFLSKRHVFLRDRPGARCRRRDDCLNDLFNR